MNNKILQAIKNQSGNALFLILIAVLLFAALSYAITRAGRGGGGIDKEKAVLDAVKIINFGNQINAAIQRMLVMGLATPSTLQYETAPFNGIPCSAGEACIFAPEGGGVTYQSPPFSPFPVPPYDIPYFFYKQGDGMKIEDVGIGANDDVLMLIIDVPKEICAAINATNNLPSPDDLPAPGGFDPIALPQTIVGAPNAQYGCVKDSYLGNTIYDFYYAFIEL